MSPVAFVPSTPAPTHFGRFRPSGQIGIFDERGAPFLTNQLGPLSRVIVEAAFGANIHADPTAWTWTDVTADVMYAPGIQIIPGTLDESSIAPPAACAFSLDNTDAAYSAYNPAGRNSPFVQRGTPIRVSIDPGTGIPVVVFQGEAAGWTPTWDTSAKLAVVKVAAAGAMRRIGQGTTPARSALTRSILQSTVARLTQFWPCEESTGAVQAGSALSAAPPLTANSAVDFGGMDLHGTLTGTIVLTPGTTFGYQSLPRLTDGGTLSASFPPTAIASGSWTLQFTAYMDPISNDHSVVVAQWREGGRLWQVISDGLSLDTSRLVVNGVTIATEPHVFINEDMIISATQVGADIHVSYKPNFSRAAQLATIAGATLAGVTTFAANPAAAVLTGDMSVGEIRIWDGIPETFQSVDVSAWSGWTGENAAERAARLCLEEGIALTQTGTSTTTMGLQNAAAFLTSLRDCVIADGGVLYDGFGPGLGIVWQDARFNLPAAVTFDMAAGEVAPPFAPVDDDQRNRNDMTVTRLGGSSARVVDTDGPLGTNQIGVYDSQLTVNTATDDPLGDIAGWRVLLGTVPGLRYPQLTGDFAATPGKVADWLAAPDMAFRVDVVNVDQTATQHPPNDVQLIVEGYTATLTPHSWRVVANCSRFDAWQVGILDDPDLSFMDPEDCSLHSDWDGTSGSILIDTLTGPLWSTAGSDYPVDINIDGQRATASGCSGTTNPQTLTISAPSVNGVAIHHYAGATVTPWFGFVLSP